MPDILHVGITKASPETDYKIKFAKKVPEPFETEKSLHHILKEYRICPDKNLFRVSLDTVRGLFDLMGRGTLTENCEEVEDVAEVAEVAEVGEVAEVRAGSWRAEISSHRSAWRTRPLRSASASAEAFTPQRRA